jgi:heptosyltransferase-2
LSGRSTILVRLPNWVGDAVMATSFLRAVRAGRPGARILVGLRPKLAGVLAGSPYLDGVIAFRRGTVGEAIRLGLRWRGAFDCAFVLPNSFRSAVFPWVAGARARIGYAGQGRGWLLTAALPPPEGEGRRRLPEPMPRYWRRLLEPAGISWQGDQPELALEDGLEEQARDRARALGIAECERMVGLSPGAAFGPSKLWAPGRFAEVAARLHEARGLRAILFVAPGEEDLGRQVLAAARSPIVSTVEHPLSLSLLKAFMRRCALLVTSDSGTRHFGVASGVPTVTLMGPTDPRYTAFCLERQEVIYREDVDCLGCHLKVCPIDHRCMDRITAEEVARRSLALLDRLV